MTDGDPASRVEMRLRRGGLRLAVSLAAVWFVFWSCAYVLQPYSRFKPEPATFAVRATGSGVLVPCLVVAVLLAGWVALGFRSGR